MITYFLKVEDQVTLHEILILCTYLLSIEEECDMLPYFWGLYANCAIYEYVYVLFGNCVN